MNKQTSTTNPDQSVLLWIADGISWTLETCSCFLVSCFMAMLGICKLVLIFLFNDMLKHEQPKAKRPEQSVGSHAKGF